MTGLEIKTRFYALYDEISNGVLSTDRLNNIFNAASAKALKPLYDEYGLTKSISDEIRPMILKFSQASPVDNEIDITALTSYKTIIGGIDCTFVVGGVSYTNTSTLLSPNALTNSPNMGSFLFPKHDVHQDVISIFPQSVQCTLAEGTYFREPFTIDVADDVIDIPYSVDLINDIMDDIMTQYGFALRDSDSIQFGNTEEQLNKTTT